MRLTKRQLKQIIRQEKSRLMNESVGGYYNIPDQYMGDEKAITAVAMKIQNSTSMSDQAAVNLAIIIINELSSLGFLS